MLRLSLWLRPVKMKSSISFHQRQTVRRSLFVWGCAAMPTSSWSRYFAAAASSGEPMRSSAPRCSLAFHDACSVQVGSSMSKSLSRSQPRSENISPARSSSRRLAQTGSAVRPRRPLVSWVRRWRTSVSILLPSRTRSKASTETAVRGKPHPQSLAEHRRRVAGDDLHAETPPERPGEEPLADALVVAAVDHAENRSGVWVGDGTNPGFEALPGTGGQVLEEPDGPEPALVDDQHRRSLSTSGSWSQPCSRPAGPATTRPHATQWLRRRRGRNRTAETSMSLNRRVERARRGTSTVASKNVPRGTRIRRCSRPGSCAGRSTECRLKITVIRQVEDGGGSVRAPGSRLGQGSSSCHL